MKSIGTGCPSVPSQFHSLIIHLLFDAAALLEMVLLPLYESL